MNSGGELFVDFEWTVAPAHDWKDWLDTHARPVIVPAEGMRSLATPAAVVLAAKQQHETGPVLCEREGKAKRYRPMQREHAALFRTFAALDYTDRDAIRAFANEYGLLGVPPQAQHLLASGTRPEHAAVGESHLAWALEICFMNEAVRWVAVPDERRTLRARDEHRLGWLFGRQLQYVRPRITDLTGRPRFSIVPQTLLAAMWLQLSQAVTGEKRYVACKFCGRFLELSTEASGYRSHRAFCSDSCKTKDYRRRKYTALKLAARGSDVAVIAERTTTSRPTIRKWLAATKVRSKPR